MRRVYQRVARSSATIVPSTARSKTRSLHERRSLRGAGRRTFRLHSHRTRPSVDRDYVAADLRDVVADVRGLVGLQRHATSTSGMHDDTVGDVAGCVRLRRTIPGATTVGPYLPSRSSLSCRPTDVRHSTSPESGSTRCTTPDFPALTTTSVLSPAGRSSRAPGHGRRCRAASPAGTSRASRCVTSSATIESV